MNSIRDARRSEVLLLRNMITAKQLSLLEELRQLYPISVTMPGPRYSIRGLVLPDKDFTALAVREECREMPSCVMERISRAPVVFISPPVPLF